MADPEDRMQPAGPPDGRPRREPPIIEGEAVEISADGSPASTPGAASWLSALLPSRKVAAAAAGVAAAAVAVALLIYLAPDGGGAPPPNASQNPAPSAGTAAASGGGETAAVQPPATVKIADVTPADKAGRSAEIPAESAAALESRLAAVDTALAALNERVATLNSAVSDAVEAARAAADRADKAVRQFEEARKSGDEQEAARELDRSAIEDLGNRLKTLESRQMTVRQIQERLDRLASATGSPDHVARAAFAAATLRNAVERDRPFAAELAAARSIGLDETALTALDPFAASGLPRRNDLFRDLSALMPELRRAAAPPGQELGYLDRIQASAARMLNIRPVKDEPGDDPATVLSRIEYKMVQQDVDAIIAELDKLPPQAKELAQPWRARAAARRDALEAARTMAAAALVKLGEPVTSGSSQQ